MATRDQLTGYRAGQNFSARRVIWKELMGREQDSQRANSPAIQRAVRAMPSGIDTVGAHCNS